MATHSSILAWRIPWTDEPGGPWGHKESDMTEHTAHKELLNLVGTGVLSFIVSLYIIHFHLKSSLYMICFTHTHALYYELYAVTNILPFLKYKK